MSNVVELEDRSVWVPSWTRHESQALKAFFDSIPKFPTMPEDDEDIDA